MVLKQKEHLKHEQRKAFLFLVQKHVILQNKANGGWWGGGLDLTRASVLSSNFFLLFQIIFIQKEPDHPSFLIDIKSKGTFSSKKEPIGKVWYIALYTYN